MTSTTLPSPGSRPEIEAARAQRPGRSALISRFLQRNGALVVLLLLVVVMIFAFSGFGSAGNLTQIAKQASFYAPLALGLTFVIFTGGIDLSVGSVFALGGVLAAWASQWGFLPALLVPLLVCGLIGLVQGALVAGTKIPAFIVTLGGLLFARGLLLFITDEGSVTHPVTSHSGFRSLAGSSFLGLGTSVWIVLVLFVIGVVISRRTSYGMTLLAIGGQEEAASLMGLPVRRSLLIAYTTSGALAGFAGAMTASYTGSGVTTLGVGLELTAISAVVLGGTILTGGAGTIMGSLVGITLLQVVANLINRLGLTNSNWQSVVNGVLLAVVAVAQIYLSKVQARNQGHGATAAEAATGEADAAKVLADAGVVDGDSRQGGRPSS
ncbi:ABC transporter permease [Galactobacter sp.]|uniref:ABC transporter permease n=1 Tax=Galactobacter sp. TaxID=2676125 RepID=UPI0025BCE46E|nr:ABC transporter permease [Galactobacter sp.]